MNKLQHSIEINAPKEKIWKVLWDNTTFRDWSGIIDEGTYMTGDLAEGKEVNFIGNDDGGDRYGITSRVEKLIPNEYILFTKTADIIMHKDGSVSKRDNQWTSGTESYELIENNDKVKLTITEDVPDELVEYFNKALPKVLERIKILAESNN